jgi:uncharacterized protein YchJ
MASAAQIDANRLNAQSSTGPTTDAGKASASRNSTRHGLASGVLFLEGEDPALFSRLVHELIADLRPAGLTQEVLVLKMAEALWLSDRAAGLLTRALELNTREDNAKQVALMLRYKTASDRGFQQALSQFLKLKKERPQSDNGFVSQNAAAVPQAQPQPEPNPDLDPAPAPPHPVGFVSKNPIPLSNSNPTRTHPKVGRNETCPCGSGLKFKRCCIDKAALTKTGKLVF